MFDITEGAPSFKVASHLDFFRAEPGRVHMSCILDDSDLRTESVASLKAYMDVSSEDARVYARWSASHFMKHQPRFICSNTFNNLEEPMVHTEGFNQVNRTITHDLFMKMLRVAFNNNACEADIAALLKRSVVVLFGNNHVYLRKPSPDPIDVVVINYPASGRDLLAESCKDRFGRYKRGEAVQAPDDDQTWSTLFVHKVIRGNIPKGFKTIAATTCPFTGTITPEQHIKPSLEEDPLPEFIFEEDPEPPQEPPQEAEGHGETIANEPTHNADRHDENNADPVDNQALVPAEFFPPPPSTSSNKKRTAFGKALSQTSMGEIDISSPPKQPRTSGSSSSAAAHEVDLERELEALMEEHPFLEQEFANEDLTLRQDLD